MTGHTVLLFLATGLILAAAVGNPMYPPVANGGTTTCQPDFTLAASPTSATLPQQNSVQFLISWKSVCGASGVIIPQPLVISPSKNGISWNWLCYCNPPIFTISPTTPYGVTQGAYLGISAAKPPKTTYTITIPM